MQKQKQTPPTTSGSKPKMICDDPTLSAAVDKADSLLQKIDKTKKKKINICVECWCIGCFVDPGWVDEDDPRIRR